MTEISGTPAGSSLLLAAMLSTLPAEAVKAANLLFPDGNLSLFMLDLLGAELRGVGRIPANAAHRFQKVIEQGNMALAVFTPRPLVEGASVKISVDWR